MSTVRRGRQAGPRQPPGLAGTTPPAGTPTRSCSSRTATSTSARAQVKTAKLICRGCPVSATCLSWALASGQEAGIWGGLTEDERRRLHRRRGFRLAAHSLIEERS